MEECSNFPHLLVVRHSRSPEAAIKQLSASQPVNSAQDTPTDSTVINAVLRNRCTDLPKHLHSLRAIGHCPHSLPKTRLGEARGKLRAPGASVSGWCCTACSLPGKNNIFLSAWVAGHIHQGTDLNTCSCDGSRAILCCRMSEQASV